MAKILIVDDTEEIADCVRTYLEYQGYEVDVCHTGYEGREKVFSFPYDLIILDWELPGVHGIEILKEYRTTGGGAPVIMLTGKTTLADKELGFDEGADDYLTKPFEMKELGARVKVHIRRSLATKKPDAGIVLDRDKKQALKDGKAVSLVPREFALLDYILSHPAERIPSEELAQRAWPDDPEATKSVLRTTVRRLRKKLDQAGTLLKAEMFPDLFEDEGSTESTQGDYDPFLGMNLDGKYELVELIGGGGTGLVYRARHMFMDTFVAVKLLFPQMTSQADHVDRFRREASSAMTLSHLNVLRVHDFGFLDIMQPYLVMELLEGRSLADLINAEGALPPARVLDYIQQTASGLAHAHEKGIVHRDIKPSNLMLLQDDSGKVVVKIVDFGLAKVTRLDNQTATLTKTGDIFGSPPYMSPEQCLGRSVDQRSDIYSLGCILYEALSGAPPFIGDSLLATILLHVHGFPSPLTIPGASPELTQNLDRIITRCLQKDREDRYASIDELEEDLKQVTGSLIS
ncbi:MAG: protein kinase [Cyanobacteria bacterium]|nr:protein kinase [Cyanobacteriota bacterium]